MKRNVVVLAVFAALVSTAPAAADSIHLSVFPTSTSLSGPTVTYQVSGEAEVKETYDVRIMSVDSSHPESECVNQTTNSQLVRGPIEIQGKATSLISFSHEEPIPVKDYSELGTYAVCAMIRGGSSFAESTTSFTVVAPPAPAPVVAPVPAPVVTQPPPIAPATPVVKPVVKPVSKLAKTLKMCEKLKKHTRRVACEKSAKRRYKK